MWSKIKKAINSTLGTKDFKPLNKIITDFFTAFKKQLTSGENEFIVKKSKQADLADRALQTAIPNTVLTESDLITDPALVYDTVIEYDASKAGIYAITWRKEQELHTTLYYISDSMINNRFSLSGNIVVYPTPYAYTTERQNFLFYNIEEKKLIIPSSTSVLVTDIAFIEVGINIET